MLPTFSPKSSTDRTLEEGFSAADASWATEGIEGMVMVVEREERKWKQEETAEGEQKARMGVSCANISQARIWSATSPHTQQNTHTHHSLSLEDLGR